MRQDVPAEGENGEQMVSRRLVVVMVLALVTPLTLMACSDGRQQPKPAAHIETPSTPVPPATLSLTPAADKKGVPISAEIGLKLSGGTITAVMLKDEDGKAISGWLRDDGTAWVPRKPLKTMHRYEATVIAENAAGQRTTATTRFTTMATPARRTGTGLYLFDDHTYGVAMPVVAEFNPGIKKADRAAVQKRMFVKTDPPQPGTWSWTSSGTQVYYRAPKYWKPGTTLTVRLAVGGLPTGGGRYGDRDRSATAKIGRSFVMSVENKTKKMTVVENGKKVRTMLVSLGKPSTPSSSGTMVIMDKHTSTIFDTTDTDGAAGYRITIGYAQRLTWSGQYVHSAPWSVGAQGHRNVSHGCVNLSPSNARWLFGKTLIGDPITVRGTGDKLVYGNGWTPWNLSWTEFAKGSALPVPDNLA
jgi:lipoprotein-anchoring transpeptidase ErfK/SrfK